VIPRTIGHIWIGPHAPPQDWLDTWKAAHPAWTYRLFDNDALTGRRWRNQALITEYYRRGKYAGVSDLMRYEILYEQGGFLPEADSICLHPVDALFTEARAYTVYEFPDGRTGMMSPFLASEPQNPVIGKVIETLATLRPEAMNNPWTTTGNGFLRRFFQANARLKEQITIFPSHYFIPEHYKGESYDGPDRIYARQLWASTKRTYPHSQGQGPQSREQVALAQAAILARLMQMGDAPATGSSPTG
jgi:mannosyltransferase OCH1-like enzyme